ncbi:MAG TPA: helix-turn-helix domain-containing protein [Saprospiraceae bacterium]|nr:helix-turn-helix domain-containing protein [Saprospiraceae bacterium]
MDKSTRDSEDVELLTLLIEKWDSENIELSDFDPVQLIKELMKQNGLNSSDLGDILNLSKGTISKMLNYQKGLSKETIRNLASHFKLSQEAFNRSYKLKNQVNRSIKDALLMTNKKKMVEVSHPA